MLNWNENDVYAGMRVCVCVWNGAHDTKSPTKMCVYELSYGWKEEMNKKKKCNETPFSYIVNVHATRTKRTSQVI